MNFQGFRCWDHQAIGEVLSIVAARPSNAVFLATHQESPLKRSSSYQNPAWTRYTEQDFLKEFLGDRFDPMIVPVIGSSGTGKSHLIRWLDLHIERTPERHVVSIPKHHTNLRDVLNLILKGLDAPSFQDFRQRLQNATDSLTIPMARLNLLTNLEHFVSSLTGHEQVVCADGTPLTSAELLIIKRFVPAFITDQVIRTALNSEGGVIDRLVREALKGRESDKADAFEIRISDLPLDVKDVAKAGANAKQYYFGLVSENKQPGRKVRQEQLVAILNHFLAPALRQLYQLGGNDLLTLMRDVRRALKDRNQELVLLIEDFALLQGIQAPLLEALIDDNPDRDLCRVRVALGVTSGYFQNMDTVHTRLAFVVSLDVEVTEVKDAQKLRFVGSYLNATREGEGNLQQHEKSLLDGTRVESVCERCPLREVCLPAFGHTEVPQLQGRVGFYPFNAQAVQVLSHQVNPEQFNPRSLLKMMGETLHQAHQSLPAGEFPNPPFIEAYEPKVALPAADLQVLQQYPDAGRLAAVMKIWGGYPPRLQNFRDGVREALRLPVFGEVPTADTEHTSEPASVPENALSLKSDGTPTPPAKVLPEKVKPVVVPDSQMQVVPPDSKYDAFRALDDWANGGELAQTEARDLRNTLFELITSHVNWEAEGIDLGLLEDHKVWAKLPSGINIKGQKNSSNISGDAVKLEVPLETQSRADMAVALQAYAHYDRHGKWPAEFPKARWLLLRMLDEWASELLKKLHSNKRGGAARDMVAPMVELLYWGAVTQGKILKSTSAHEALQAMVTRPLEVSVKAPLEWQNLLEQARKSHQDALGLLLSRVGIGKGGKTRILDAELLLDVIKRTSRRPEMVAVRPDFDRKDVDKRRQDFFARFEQAHETVAAFAKEAKDHLEMLLEGSVDWEQTVQQLEAAISAATSAGVVRSVPHWEPSKIIEECRAIDIVQVLDQVKKCIQGPQSHALAQLPFEQMHRAREAGQAALAFLEGSRQAAEHAIKVSQFAEDAGTKITEILSLLEDTERVLASFQEVKA